MPLSDFGVISLAYGLNHYLVDRPYSRLLRVFSRELADFASLGEFAGREVYEATYWIDRFSNPYLASWSVLGERADASLLPPEERRILEKLVLDFGVNRHPFEGRPWHNHYTALYLIGDPGISCILTITIQTAYALYKYADGQLRDLYKGLIGAEKEPLWGATWFTEVQGGSDLGANTTIARPEGDKYILYGYKYFASGAGVADVALTTARLPGSRPGAKGLSLFLVPRINSRGELNYYVRRLKWKSGTVPVPTGEVEFMGSEAHLIGEAEKGIYYTMEDLMVSRLANSIGALGIARKAYLEAYGYASIRRAFGKRLVEHKLALRDLLDMEAEIEASTALTLYAISLFDSAWGSRPPYNEKYHYARLMTHIVKNMTAETASMTTQLAMEVFGGIGFLHEFAVERWHREALITPIWEGTSNIQALDMLEAMYKKGAHNILLDAMEELATSSPNPKLAEESLNIIRKTLGRASENPSEAEYYAKDILRSLGRASAVLLLLDAARHTGDSLFETIARYYYETRIARNHESPVPPAEAREIASLRGALDEIDWEAKARDALKLRLS